MKQDDRLTYSAAIEFLHSLRVFGAKFGLENAFRLAAVVDSPQAKLRFIHVAGTNGKGSTCAMLESIYRAAGLRVGLFTSPHLVSFRERIQVNRRLIPEADLARLVTELRAAADAPETTLFELATVLALKYFAEQQCDLVIWETGLGGRLDATNIVTPLASVITNIALDHTQWLGDTVEKIAAEKAGIIKPGVPVVTAEDKLEALGVIERAARDQGAALTRVSAPSATRYAPPASLLGDHQELNAALALATVAVLQPQIPVAAEAVRAGLAEVNWPGRFQLVTQANGRKILLDGAHNAAGAAVLRAALAKHFPGESGTLILGVLQDKDYPRICDLLAPLAKRILTVPVASERTAAAADLAFSCRGANPTAAIVACRSLAEALAQAASDRWVILSGSLYLIGEALEQLGLSPADPVERGLNEWAGRCKG